MTDERQCAECPRPAKRNGLCSYHGGSDLERCYSLRAAAKLLGVSSRCLKKMLAGELSLILPSLPKGEHNMIRESVLERLVDRRGPQVFIPRHSKAKRA